MDQAVEQIKARINIVDVVGAYVTLKRAGRTYMARCPFHKERTPSFHVSPERGTYKCFGCGEGGDVFSFIQKMDGVDFPTALKQLAEKAGVKLEKRFARPVEEVEKTERLISVCNEATEFFRIELRRRKDVQDYLYSRGIKETTIDSWNLGYAPSNWNELSRFLLSKNFSQNDILDSGLSMKSDNNGQLFDRFRGRVMFPISDSAGKVIAFSGRFFEKTIGQNSDIEPAKYINSPETLIFKKSRTLYGYDRAHKAIFKNNHTLLVEGQFDLVLCHQIGLTNTVALSGTALTEEHLNRLGKLSKRLKLALDADNAGIKAGLKSTEMAFRQGFEVKIPLFPEGKDPADLARENPELLKAAIQTSKAAVEFFLDYILSHKMSEINSKKEAQKSILPLLASIKSPIDQEHFINVTAQKLSIHPEVIQAEIKRSIRINYKEAPSPDIHPQSAESSLNPLQKKIGMLLFKFGRESDIGARLVAIVGEETVAEVERELAALGEDLRFRFDHEVGEHSSEDMIAGDMLGDIARQLERERFKRQFV